MIYFKSNSGRDDVMAFILIVEEVIWHESQSTSAAESEAGKADGEDLDSFTNG